MLFFSQCINGDKHAEACPKQHLRPGGDYRPTQPKPLIGVKKGSDCKYDDGRQQDSCGRIEVAQAKIRGKEHRLLHEVFPIDVGPPPEFTETESQPVTMHDFGEIEAEQVQNADNHMKLSGKPQNEQKVRNNVAEQAPKRGDISGAC